MLLIFHLLPSGVEGGVDWQRGNECADDHLWHPLWLGAAHHP